MFIGGLMFSLVSPIGGLGNATSSGAPFPQGIDPMNYVNPFYVVGAVIGAIVAFILATMLVKKSVRVFNISSLRRFGIFAVAVAIFFVCTMTNITGAETRVPAPAEVQTAALSIHAFTVPPYKYSVLDWTTDNIPIRGESDIAALCELHRNALKENAYTIDNSGLSIMAEDGNVEIDTETGISYALKNGGRELRSYMLPSKYLTGSEAYARLLASDSVKKQMNIGRLIGYGNLDLPELSHQNGSSTADLDTDIREKFGYGDVADLAALLDEDFEAMDAEDMLNPGKELFTLRLSSSNLKEKTEGLVYGSVSAALSGNGKILSKYIEDNEYEDPSIFTLYYTVTDKNVKAIEWLKSKGIYDSIMKSAAEMESRAAQDEFNPDTGTYE
jgi:hypothetical protein